MYEDYFPYKTWVWLKEEVSKQRYLINVQQHEEEAIRHLIIILNKKIKCIWWMRIHLDDVQRKMILKNTNTEMISTITSPFQYKKVIGKGKVFFIFTNISKC